MPHTRGPRSRTRRGFTLIEAAMTTVIIGVGIVAMVEAQQSFMRSNTWSSQASTAAYLAGELRERMRDTQRHDPQTGLTLDDTSGSPVLRGWGPEEGEIVIDDFDDIDDFDGISFSFVGTPGPADGDLPGPVSAARATIRQNNNLVDLADNIIPEIGLDGSVVLTEDGDPVPLQGWTQTVTVEKVDPFDMRITIADNADPRGIGVDQYPMRVTVIVDYQELFNPVPEEITRLVWIAP